MSRISPRFHYVALTAIIVLAIDQVTKVMAVRHLSTKHVTHVGPFNLRLVYDLGSTGHPVHASTAYLIGTRLIVVVLMIGVLFMFKSKIASVGVGLIFGAMLGNFLSLVLGAHQVPDFLVLGHIGQTVLTANLADFCSFGGIVVLSCSVMMRVLRVFRSIEAKQGSGAKRPVPQEPLVPVGVETTSQG